MNLAIPEKKNKKCWSVGTYIFLSLKNLKVSGDEFIWNRKFQVFMLTAVSPILKKKKIRYDW